MEQLIYKYINNPEDARSNFDLAFSYLDIKHYAGAISHFQRCAEFGNKIDDALIIYESLLQISLCFKVLGDRRFIEEGYLLQAVAFMPNRFEAYWLLSRFYETQYRWQESYTMACMGLHFAKEKSPMKIGYEKYMLVFQKTIAAWWIGRQLECRRLLFSLPEYPLNEEYRKSVQQNMSKIGSGPDPFLPYTKDKFDKLIFKFKGCETIEKNFSQTYQDMFILSVLDGKRGGYYLEIGSAEPYLGSNTALLEHSFGWDGVSIEIDEKFIKPFKSYRKNPVVCRDATEINYSKFIKGMTDRKVIDYLQLDCEPPETTYNILLSIPFEQYKFRVITFEHDYYADASRKFRTLSRKFLKSQGYLLVVSNISPNENSPFEDWWVCPDIVDMKIVDRLMANNDSIKQAEMYMLGYYKDNTLQL
jgi:hypothetical protein